MTRFRSLGSPATLGQLMARGVRQALVTCNAYNCGHGIAVALADIKRPSSLPLAQVKFKCAKCGSKDMNAAADDAEAGM